MSGNRQGGFALVLSLILVTVVTGLCVGFVKLAIHTSRGQAGAVDQMRAFYLAEAGLAEAFHAIRMGRSGQIGTSANAASYGDGTIWVQSAQTSDSRVWLRATASVGGGRAVLGMIIEPEEPPLGFFAHEDIVFEAPLLADGFDSTERDYHAEVQAILNAMEPVAPAAGNYFVEDPLSPHHAAQVAANETAGIVGPETLLSLLRDQMTLEPYPILLGPMTWVYHDFPTSLLLQLTPAEFDRTMSLLLPMRAALDAGALMPPIGGEANGPAVLDPWTTMHLARTADGIAGDSVAAGDLLGDQLFGAHTYRGGLIGSNGDISFVGEAANSAIFGSVVPGVDGTVLGLAEGAVSGSTTSRAMVVELSPVQVPSVDTSRDILHSSLVPGVVSPEITGLGTLHVSNGSEVIVRGPTKLVVTDLLLEGGSTLTLDTRDGPVELFITGSLHMDPASFVETTGLVAGEVTIQAGPVDPTDPPPTIALDAVSTFRGTIYAPESTVHIGPDFEIFGGVACRRLEIASGAQLHFDDETYNGVLAVPKQDSWRILELPTPAARPSQRLIAGAGAAQDHPPLASAHDLQSVQLSLRYTDVNGVSRTYAGSEADFNWGSVASVEAQERSAAIPHADAVATAGGAAMGASASDAVSVQGKTESSEESVNAWGSSTDRTSRLEAIVNWIRSRDW